MSVILTVPAERAYELAELMLRPLKEQPVSGTELAAAFSIMLAATASDWSDSVYEKFVKVLPELALVARDLHRENMTDVKSVRFMAPEGTA